VCVKVVAMPRAAFQIKVLLPDGWARVQDDGPGRAYRAEYGTPAGWLRLTLYPPLRDFNTTNLPPLDGNPKEIVFSALGDNPGKLLQEAEGDSTLGQLFYWVFKHPKYGIVAVFLSAGGWGTIFGTYEMGGTETVQRELDDALSIMESADIVEFDPHRPASERP
jgi:hypothetical protein